MLSLLFNLIMSIGGAYGNWATFLVGRVFFMISSELLLISSLITVINMFYYKGFSFIVGLFSIIPIYGIMMSERFSP